MKVMRRSVRMVLHIAALSLTTAVVLGAASCGGDQVTNGSVDTTGSATSVTSAGAAGPAASATTSASTAPAPSGPSPYTTLSYRIVDSGQTLCYSDKVEIPAPAPGEDFYGQDAQYSGDQPSYTGSDDGLTVTDNVTGLVWQQSPDTNGDGLIDVADKMTYEEAMAYPATLNAQDFGGFSDWRLPTIKELYSLILFIGTDANPQATSSEGQIPFINTDYFVFAYGDLDAGERIIDSQYASSTRYVSTTMEGNETLFGVNFADGRIKGYPIATPSGVGKKFVVLCVRGNPDYGKNDFVDNGDGIVTDRATGLMWAQGDSGKGLDWQEALAWAQQMNRENYLGHDDWRVPGVKELQSIIDYTRSPDTTQSAAIDPVFTCSEITNELGQPDFPCYWTSTTHLDSSGGGQKADYMAFGRAMGYMVPGAGLPEGPEAGGPPESMTVAGGKWMDVHGAGAQRSDPKVGDPADFPHGRGPQGDAIRIYNYVRLVRDAG